MSAPTLSHNCGSWVIVVKGTLNAVRETFNQSLADRIADYESDRFDVLPADEYLRRFNQSLNGV